MSEYKNKGYLHAPFKLFYIANDKVTDFELHYHEFHKILIFLRGNVTYYIEGKNYSLVPNDIVLVNAGDIHRPIVHDSSCYERIIMYLSPKLFDDEFAPLYRCFAYAKSINSNIIHNSAAFENFKIITEQLKHSVQDTSEMQTIHQKVHVTDFLIHLNDYVLSRQEAFELEYVSNHKIIDALKYINEHLSDNLKIDEIARNLYISPSYLMHLFKDETGYTLMNYIEKKRLFAADSLIASGMSKTEACYRCGFKNYAAYYYASRKNR